MEFKKLFILFIPLTLICILLIWFRTNKYALASPDKIIIYNNGIQMEINKNNKYFDKIVSLTNQRLPNELHSATDVINNQIMDDIYNDGIGIEFVYSEEQTLPMPDGNVKYYRLYFQLTSKKFKDTSFESPVNTFQCGGENGFKGFSRGPLAYSSQLVDLVKVIK